MEQKVTNKGTGHLPDFQKFWNHEASGICNKLFLYCFLRILIKSDAHNFDFSWHPQYKIAIAELSYSHAALNLVVVMPFLKVNISFCINC